MDSMKEEAPSKREGQFTMVLSHEELLKKIWQHIFILIKEQWPMLSEIRG
jgi:hypothetical protein